MGFGGKGANQCVMCARLGARTAMVAKVGKDTFGDGFLKQFTTDNINTDHVSTTDQAMTGAAPICVEESGQNSIVIVPGANLLLDEGDLQWAESLIQGSKVIVCQLEVAPQVTLAALKMARKLGVRTIFNPAPAIQLDPEFYKYTDVICPNESEAEILTGIQVKTPDDATRAVKLLLSSGCSSVIVTLGHMGCVVAAPGSADIIHIPAPTVKVVDTTGAGDSFIGALALFLSTRPDLDFVECARRSVAVASTSVQREGTQTSYLTRDQMPPEIFQ